MSHTRRAFLRQALSLGLLGISVPPLWAQQDERGSRRDERRRRRERPADERPARRRGAAAFEDPVTNAPRGLRYATCESRAAGGQYSYLVYLPPSYENSQKRYPVLYWLHGGGGNQRTGAPVVQRIDDAIRERQAPEMIVILVNGVGSSMFLDSADGEKPVETAIVQDLLPHVDETYRTLPGPRGRGVEGFSMGGFGALHLAFKHPDKFGVLSSLAPALLKPDADDRKYARAFEEPPISGDRAYFAKHDPFALLERNAGRIRPMRIRLAVGDDDRPYTVRRTRELRNALKRAHVEHTYVEVPGVSHAFEKLYEVGGASFVSFFKDAFENPRP